MRTVGKHVGDIMVSQEENIPCFVHPFPEPVGSQTGAPEMIFKIIKIIAEKNCMVILLRCQPMLCAFYSMMDIRDNQCPHAAIGQNGGITEQSQLLMS